MNNKKCETIDCKTNSRTYNFEGETIGKYCATCGKKQGMINVKTGKSSSLCVMIGCVSPVLKYSLCEEHVEEKRKNGICEFAKCENIARFMNPLNFPPQL